AAGLQKLRTQIKDCAAWADSLMLHGDVELPYEWHEELHDLVHALNDCNDDLGTAQQQLQHGMADVGQALSSHAGHLRALQHTLLFARLQPLSHMQERLTHCVELAARDTGKSVELWWQGAETPMDRSVLEVLTPALEHLLRNCVAHGIEKADTRQASQKPASGKIQIRLHNAGQQQLLSLQDDGAGLDTAAIRQKALALGLIAPEESVDNARAAALILQPGLSTAPTITELAGRGIGMDVVADTIASLGGKLRITSAPGQGCRFDITLPAPPQVEQVLAVRAG
ncbi:MAG: ATP-binding protein, partial [Comamonas sp.]